VIAGVRDGLCDSRGVVGIGTGVRFGGLGVTDGSDRDTMKSQANPSRSHLHPRPQLAELQDYSHNKIREL
jgi:hypothetical protein